MQGSAIHTLAWAVLLQSYNLCASKTAALLKMEIKSGVKEVYQPLVGEGDLVALLELPADGVDGDLLVSDRKL